MRLPTGGMHRTRAKVYRAIIEYKMKYDGNSPPASHIAMVCGVSTGTVRFHIDKLVENGWLKKRGFEISVVGGKWEYTNPMERPEDG